MRTMVARFTTVPGCRRARAPRRATIRGRARSVRCREARGRITVQAAIYRYDTVAGGCSLPVAILLGSSSVARSGGMEDESLMLDPTAYRL